MRPVKTLAVKDLWRSILEKEWHRVIEREQSKKKWLDDTGRRVRGDTDRDKEEKKIQRGGGKFDWGRDEDLTKG